MKTTVTLIVDLEKLSKNFDSYELAQDFVHKIVEVMPGFVAWSLNESDIIFYPNSDVRILVEEEKENGTTPNV